MVRPIPSRPSACARSIVAQAVRRRAVDRPVVEARVEAELELDHARLLHLPRPVHRERLLEIGRAPRRARPPCSAPTIRLREAIAVPGPFAPRAPRGYTSTRWPMSAQATCGPKNTASVEAGRAARRADALGAHLERRVRALAGREAQPPARHADIGRPRSVTSSPLQRRFMMRERFLELGHAVLAPEPGRLQLALAIADRDADVEPSVGDVVEGGHVLGDVHGVQRAAGAASRS